MAYNPTTIPTATPLSAATLQANISAGRQALVVFNTDLGEQISTDKIVSPKTLASTDTGYEVYYESGFLVTRSQQASDLRAPAIAGAWTAPAGWSYYEPTTQRNVTMANRPLNGVVTNGNVNNSGATIFVQRKSYVIVTITFAIGPQPPEDIAAPLTNNPDTVQVFIQHRDETGTVSPWVTNYVRQQPVIVLDSYLRSHTLQVAGVVDAGWHSWNLLVRDIAGVAAYSVVGAITSAIEGFYCEG